MDSRELGLVLMQQLLGLEDLHFGLWDDDLPLCSSNIATAQQRYTDMLLAALPAAASDSDGVRVLDIGCGTGHLLAQMLDQGYRVDGVIPTSHFAELVRQRLAHRAGNTTRLYECRFEELPDDACRLHYDVALFAESHQYIPMARSFPKLERLVKHGGRVVICDFFATQAPRDRRPGDSGCFGSGHSLQKFYTQLKETPFTLLRDQDITAKVSPTLELVNQLLMTRLSPAGATLGRYMKDNHPFLSWLIFKLFRKKFERMKTMYFSGHLSKEVFEGYKTYRLIVLQRQPRAY